MLIVSAKVSKRKFLLGLAAAVCVILLLVFLFQKSDSPGGEAGMPGQTDQGGTNEDRLAFLRSYGWEPSEAPVETQEVRIPETFNDVFSRYNRLQQSQGFDLANFAGKTVQRYVYHLNNHPSGDQACYATVLVYKNKIIGGDVTCSGQGGSMQGFTMNNGS